MGLTETLISSMTSIDSLSALVSRTNGATPKQIKDAITCAIPSLINTLSQNVSTEEGAQSLMGALSQHTNSGSMRSQLAGADLVDGDNIISKIMGPFKTDFLSDVSRISGLDFNQARTVMSCIAPAMMSAISAANTTYNAPGARSGVDASYPQGTTRSSGPEIVTPAPAPISAPVSAPASEGAQLVDQVKNLFIDEEDKKIIEGLKGKSLSQTLKDLLL